MGGKARRELQRDMQRSTDNQVRAYQAEQAIQRKLLAKQKAEYRAFEFKNPYENMENFYAGMENMYAGMENVYEDLTVSTQAADFQMEQGAQQRANIMQALQGAAGGSGIAGLAQTLASQGALQARQSSIDIMQQERQNAAMKAQGAMALQQMERQGAMTLQQGERQGAAAADMAERGGAAMVQSAEMQRQSTLLGIEYGGMAGANAGLQAAYGNQMSAYGASAGMVGAQMGMWGDIAGGLMQGLGGGVGSKLGDLLS